MLEIGGFLGIAELTSTLEWLHPMAQRNSEAVLFHPRDFGPGGSHGAKVRDSPADVELIPERFSCKSNPRLQRLGLNTLQQIGDSLDVFNGRQRLIKAERLVLYETNTVMLGNVGSHSCTII